MPNAEKTDIKKSILKTYAFAVGLILLLAYVIGLINPLTGPYLQYPYYTLFCGRKPVLAHSFMGSKWFITPDMKNYDVSRIPNALYCTENEARAHGYRKKFTP